ncbi:sulfotransferase domain-containing protein [Microbulbifer sp. JMSA008]|uniref:sulfotransferase domain-containing protein n=1 Tax=unclassified Microbulbifer TaxID=2619833 RepID=UPI00403A8BF7
MRILIYGLSKSGTTFLHTIIKNSMEEYLRENVQEVFEPFDIQMKAGVIQYVKEGISKTVKSHENEIVKTLLDSGITPKQILAHQNFYDKKIFIVRDPRDRFISQILYRWHWAHRPDKVKFERTLRLVRYKELNPKDIPATFLFNQNPNFYPVFSGKMSDTYLRALRFLKRASKDWLILKYEDLIDGNVEKLQDYLSFPILKNISVDENHKGVVRSKAYGNWRKWYTDEDVVFFKPIFKRYMHYLKYDFSDWQLEYPESLPKEHGSEYMLKISSKEKSMLINTLNSLGNTSGNGMFSSEFRALFSKIYRAVKLK